MDELRVKLLQLLQASFPDYPSLRAFADAYDATLAATAVVDPDARSLAAQLIDDALQGHTVPALLKALRRARPALAARIAEIEAAPALSKRAPIMGVPTRVSGNARPISSHPHPHPSKPTTSAPQGRPETATDDGPVIVSAPGAQAPASPGTEAAQPRGIEVVGGDPPGMPPGPTPSPWSAPPPPRPPVAPQRLSLGFVTPAQPDEYLLKHHTLTAATRYLLWVEIAPELAVHSLAGDAPMHGLRQDDELDVIVFPFPDQLALEGERHGRVQIGGSGNVVVRPAHVAAGTAGAAARTTLYFAVRTPDRLGRFALRVHVYCRGVLLQSHLVSAEVAEPGAERADALSRKVDYNLSAQLDTGRITPDAACRASLFINDDGRGTHSFRFVSSKEGVPEHIGDAHVEGVQLARMVQLARKALRWSAWGTEEPWTQDRKCKFADQLDRKAFTPAIEGMARRGAQLYMQIAAQFAFVGADDQLREHMREPGRVQIALKESPDAILPIALIYDYPLDSGLKNMTTCAAALAAIGAGRALADEPCFRGQCPSYDDDSVVCPGGFWGFRHDLGLPLHVPRGEVATVIPRGDGVRAFAPVSRDPELTMRKDHLASLAQLAPQWLEILDTRAACLNRLQEPRQLVYFYCHGGLTDSALPFLEVGDRGSDPILAQTLFNKKIRWPEPLRPLVILNGCHTTATSPDEIFSMLTAFATHCNAAGIIGTEITNFELIAGIFGEELLRRFLNGEQLGSCVRLARLELLRRGNPLGLMYIPFALPSLHLEG